MTFQEYQTATQKFAQYPKDRALDYLVSGLAAECGEVAGKWAKIIRQDPNVSIDDVMKEASDVMWFVSQLCNETGYMMEGLAKENIRKLQDRLDRGVIKGSGDSR